MSRFSKLVYAVVCIAVVSLVGATGLAEPAAEKAMKYHSVLLRRPTPGYLYDRFFNTWLETSMLVDLQQFLESRVENNDATADIAKLLKKL